MNAQVWRILTISLVAVSLSGCASLFNNVDPLEVQTTETARTPLNLSMPNPLKSRTPRWIVITPENADEIWNRLEAENTDLVLFALTDKGYEELSVSMAEIRNFIAEQRRIIIKYKDYYEPAKEVNKK